MRTVLAELAMIRRCVVSVPVCQIVKAEEKKRKEDAAATFDNWVALKDLTREALSCMEVLPSPTAQDEANGTDVRTAWLRWPCCPLLVLCLLPVRVSSESMSSC